MTDDEPYSAAPPPPPSFEILGTKRKPKKEKEKKGVKVFERNYI